MSKSNFEWFPKDTKLRTIEAFFYLIVLGTFGAHQFYLGNKKRGYYFLITGGISHVLIILLPYIYHSLHYAVGFKVTMFIIFSGYLLVAPVWIWDLITLTSQVRDKNGQADLL